MAHPVLETEECIGCGICVDACPQDVLEIAGGVVGADGGCFRANIGAACFEASTSMCTALLHACPLPINLI